MVGPVGVLSLRIRVVILSICIAFALGTGCAPSTTDPSTDAATDRSQAETRPVVFVVNYPLEYFARRIGGDRIRVMFPVPQGQDPAYWEPSGDQIAEIQAADLVLLNGADYAKWTLRATLPWSRTVVTTEGLEDDLIEIPDAVVHSHGPEGEHSHAGIVSETWLDPRLAIRQARVVCDALRGLLPEQEPALESQFTELEGDLRSVAQQLDECLENTPLRWFSAKPRFHYLLAPYGIAPEVLHWEAGVALESTQWEQWESMAERLDGAPAVVLWSEPPASATRDRLAAKGVQSIVIDTAASPPAEGDLLSVMRANVDSIRSATASRGTSEVAAD